jgi:hypothetical protein
MLLPIRRPFRRAGGSLPASNEAGSDLVIYAWSHFLRKTGVHFSGKCSSGHPQAADARASCVWVTVRRKRRRTLSSLLRISATSRGRPSSPRNA